MQVLLAVVGAAECTRCQRQMLRGVRKACWSFCVGVKCGANNGLMSSGWDTSPRFDCYFATVKHVIVIVIVIC